MALFDKLKEGADIAKQKVTEVANVAKSVYDQAAAEAAEKKAAKEAAEAERKAAEEAHRNEMLAQVSEIISTITSKIEANYSDDLDGFFNGKTKEEVFDYARNFFDKILLPANSKSETYISMYPQISKKLFEKMKNTFGATIPYDSCLVYLYDNDSNEFLLTYDNFYYKMPLVEDKKFNVIGSVPTSKVSLFTLTKIDNDAYVFSCDDVQIAKINIMSGKEADFITLNSFFNDIKNRDFDITDQDVDKVIRKKIGAITCTELANEMDSDELLMFFTWNSDGGYVACTNEKIIYADKKSGGNISNICRFYYDEITKVETIQEESNLTSTSSATSLTGFLVDMAVSAAADAAIDSFLKDVCDLRILATGSYKTMSGMVKLEADRIVAIYNMFKKDIRSEERALKMQATSPQVVVQQQQNQPDILEQIQKLASLKDAGILTEEEFVAKKADLLAKL